MGDFLVANFLSSFPRERKLSIHHRKLHHILHCKKRSLSPGTHSGSYGDCSSQIVLPALLQKLVGEFFDFSQGILENFVGNLEGIFRGFFLTHRTKAQKFRGKFRSIFRKKIRGSKKIFRAK